MTVTAKVAHRVVKVVQVAVRVEHRDLAEREPRAPVAREAPDLVKVAHRVVTRLSSPRTEPPPNDRSGPRAVPRVANAVLRELIAVPAPVVQHALSVRDPPEHHP